MSRGPRAKGTPERESNKKENEEKKKEKEEKKRENETDGGPTRYIPVSLSGWQKIPKSNIGYHTQSLKYETNNGKLGPQCILFQLACDLKFLNQNLGS